MSQTRFLLPDPLARLCGLLPAYPGSFLFANGLNLALKDSLPEDVRQRLAGRKLRIRIADARIGFDFEWDNGRFRACLAVDQPDLTISASGHDFLLLAQRKEDPDTLFFSRRLSMEGDTELGLLVKNTLDAIDFPVFDPGRFAPARVLGRIQAGRSVRG